ncbi:MAG TPA: FAD-dependent oxidoreductase [Alphaproteobacteria bacterium]|jgi:3-phenylpropionate/trans-cinnamate dioxygenase ferredoxin reductase subunit
MSETIVIVGAGHAGGRAAQALRAAGFAGRVVLIGEEKYPPYERPPLSKELIVTDAGLEKARLHDPAYYEQNKIELMLGRAVEAIDRTAKTVKLAGGAAVAYDKLLLTTGARVRKLPIPGADLPGVFYLRDFDDTQAIRARLAPGVRAVVIGGGFIGLETAASAVKRGATVSVLEAADRLMGRAVAPEIGAWFAELHRKKGVDLRLAVRIKAIAGAGKVERVVLDGADPIPADIVIIGIGIVPNVELAAAAELEVGNGIVVDEFGRTSDPAIWAAGDCALQPNAFLARKLRLESYQNAQDQAMAVARNMIGEPRPYEDSLWVWSDQHDVNLQMTGAPEGYDKLVWRGDPAGGAFMVFYLKDSRIVAVNTVNMGREMKPAQRLMQSKKSFDSAQLADPNVRLLKLAKE